MTHDTLIWIGVALILIIALFTLLMVYFFLKQDFKRRRLEILAHDQAEILKLRFLAFERLSLLLERLSPESLILREQRHDLKCMAFHTLLLKLIRQEFNHNLAMQIYISIPTWEKIKQARESLIKLVNQAASSCKAEAPALELGRIIIENAGTETNFRFNDALNAIKREIEMYYSV